MTLDSESKIAQSAAGADDKHAFKPMSQPSLVNLVETSLRTAIFEGRLRPGERVSDAKIAAQMGISRAPVREAIRQLAVSGLLREEARKGTFVTRMTRTGVRAVYDCRRALEGLAARRVAQLPRREGLVSRLRALIAEMEKYGRAGEHVRMAEADARFHLALCEMSGNDWLVRLYGHLSDQTRLMQTIDQLAHVGQDPRMSTVLHESIVTALESGNPDRAEQAIREHIDLSERLFLAEVPNLED